VGRGGGDFVLMRRRTSMTKTGGCFPTSRLLVTVGAKVPPGRQLASSRLWRAAWPFLGDAFLGGAFLGDAFLGDGLASTLSQM